MGRRVDQPREKEIIPHLLLQSTDSIVFPKARMQTQTLSSAGNTHDNCKDQQGENEGRQEKAEIEREREKEIEKEKEKDPAGREQEKDHKADNRFTKVKGLDKQHLCIDLLLVGCVQSFVDFFYISHKMLGNNSCGEESDDQEIAEDKLCFFKDTLETAEKARRTEDWLLCLESYGLLSEHFEKLPDLKNAMRFHQRWADVAEEADAPEKISKANLNLGLCEEKAGHWHNARIYHEKALEVATSADQLPLQIQAASRLTAVYQILAELCEEEGQNPDAVRHYERCLKCARLSKDSKLEGAACHKLGLSKYKNGSYDAAIDLQKEYLEICCQHDDRSGESAARSALARASEAMGNSQEAIKQFENLLNVASEAGELEVQANACLNLGILYVGRGDQSKAAQLLVQHFDLARQVGDKKLIDFARVVLGTVRGHAKLGIYIDLVNDNLEKLLMWKSFRMIPDKA